MASFFSCVEKRADVEPSFVLSTRFGIRNETPQSVWIYEENPSGGGRGQEWEMEEC